MSKKAKSTVSIDGGPEIDMDKFTDRVQSLTNDLGAGTVQNHLLRAMAEHGAKDLIRAIAIGEAEILDDIQRIRDESEEDEKLKFKVGLSITLDLDKSTVDTAFSYSVKTSVKKSHQVGRPEEPEFEFEGRDA